VSTRSTIDPTSTITISIGFNGAVRIEDSCGQALFSFDHCLLASSTRLAVEFLMIFDVSEVWFVKEIETAHVPYPLDSSQDESDSQ
jgi:hypothetical protein